MCQNCEHFSLPGRTGTRPRTTDQTPHVQLNQNAPADMHSRLIGIAQSFANVRMGKSAVSFPETTAFLLSPTIGNNSPPEAFMAQGYEFAHLHAQNDGSLHMCLPVTSLKEVYAKGWGEPHPIAGKFGFPKTIAMIFGPRDEGEFATVAGLLQMSYDFASGKISVA